MRSKAKSRTMRVDQVYPKKPKDSDGYWLCRYCGERIAKCDRYLAWHSTCRHEAYIRTYPNDAASNLRQREHGVCRHCGIDTEALQLAMRELRDKSRGWHAWNAPAPSESEMDLWRAVLSSVANAMKQRGWDIDVPSFGFPSWSKLWNMDHIVEHAEGGDLEPSNLQTLCVPCHKAKTRVYAAERAGRRKTNAVIV